MGWEELLTWAAFEEVEPPDLEDNVRFAKLAFYAGNAGNFKEAVQLDRLLPHFGVGEMPEPGARSLAGFASLLETLGGEMPDHVRERFEDGDSSDSHDPDGRGLDPVREGAGEGERIR